MHKRPEALARYYVTSYWQAEWVKNWWRTRELPPPPLALPPVVTLISYRLFVTAKIAQIKFDCFLIFNCLKNWGMFDDLELKLRHCVSGNTSFESLPENV